jgi:SCY1-like protein 2
MQAKLKHPAVLRLIHSIEEVASRRRLVFVTEPIVSSLAEVLLHDEPTLLSKSNTALGEAITELEVKHGLLQVAEGLQFLHCQAGIAHRGVCPTSVLLTEAGEWKLAGFAFAESMNAAILTPFDYRHVHPSLIGMALQPSLEYQAPEMIAELPQARQRGSHLAPAADIFCFAVLSCELITRRRLFPVGFSVGEYQSRLETLEQLGQAGLAGLPSTIATTLARMLSIVPEARPALQEFTRSPYFTRDVDLTALKFLESVVEKSVQERISFLQRQLPSSMVRFDDRILLRRVLPSLLQDVRAKETQLAALPLLLQIIQRQPSDDFERISLPALRSLLDTATGPALVLLAQNASAFFQAASSSTASRLVSNLLARALAPNEVLCHEAALQQLAHLAEELDGYSLSKQLVPAVSAVCLTTTVAVVRVAAFKTLAAVANRLDHAQGLAMLATARDCIAADKSAPTVMAILGLGESLARKWGPVYAAEHVLPLIMPCLAISSLSPRQFSTIVKSVRDIINLIEKAKLGAEAAAASTTESKRSSDMDVIAPIFSSDVPMQATAPISKGLFDSGNYIQPKESDDFGPWAAGAPSTSTFQLPPFSKPSQQTSATANSAPTLRKVGPSLVAPTSKTRERLDASDRAHTMWQGKASSRSTKKQFPVATTSASIALKPGGHLAVLDTDSMHAINGTGNSLVDPFDSLAFQHSSASMPQRRTNTGTQNISLI